MRRAHSQEQVNISYEQSAAAATHTSTSSGTVHQAQAQRTDRNSALTLTTVCESEAQPLRKGSGPVLHNPAFTALAAEGHKPHNTDTNAAAAQPRQQSTLPPNHTSNH